MFFAGSVPSLRTSRIIPTEGPSARWVMHPAILSSFSYWPMEALVVSDINNIPEHYQGYSVMSAFGYGMKWDSQQEEYDNDYDVRCVSWFAES